MRIPRTLSAGVLIAAAVILGLLTVQGTYALWSASASAAPGAVSSASFDVSLTASPSEQVSSMTLAGGPATISLTQTASLSPGTSVYASLAVSNNTNAGGQFSTVITAGELAKVYTGAGTIASYLTFSGKNVATAAECSNAAGYAPLTAAGMTSVAVPKRTSTVFCFQVSLSSTAPVSVKGQAVNISLPITARQLCGVPSGC